MYQVCTKYVPSMYISHVKERYEDVLRIGQVGPRLGPYALTDDFGMKVALTMVLKSLEPGRNADTVRYDSAVAYR